MKKIRKIKVVMPALAFAASLLWMQPASACQQKIAPYATQFETAEKVFIGTVVSIRDDVVRFHVEKALRNAGDDGSVAFVPLDTTMCGINFKPGQNWLFLGASTTSGSQMIVDEYGHVIPLNAKFVRETYGYHYRTRHDIHTAQIYENCMPDQDRRTVIKIGTTRTALLSAPLSALKDNKKQAIFTTTGTGNTKHGQLSLTFCESIKTPDRKGAKKHIACHPKSGTVYIDPLRNDTTDGAIEWAEVDGRLIRQAFYGVYTPESGNCTQ